jgi:WD40 repeat protein
VLRRAPARRIALAACLTALCGLVSRADDPAPPEAKPAVDLHGDPLPFGALARIGTVRFRYHATSVAWSPDGKLLAAGGADNQIRLLDAETGKELRRFAGHRPRTFHPAFNPKNGAFDALVDSVGEGDVTTVAFSPDGKTLASGGWDETVRLWDVETGKERRSFLAHQDGLVAAVRFSPDGKYLASRGGNDGVVRLWDAATGAEVRKYEGLAKANPWRFNRDAALAFSPDAKTLAVGDRKVIHFYDTEGGKETATWEAHPVCLSLAYSADGKTLASGGVDGNDDHSLRLWDVEKGKERLRCTLPKNEPPTSLAFSPDSAQLAAAVEEDDLRVFDASTGKPAHQLKHYWPSRVAFSPDGKTLVSAGGPTVRLWDPATGTERAREFEGHNAGVTAVALSPDRQLLATAGEQVRLWDAQTGKPGRVLATSAAALAFAPDGKTLATAGRDGIVHFWEVESGKETGQLKGHKHMLIAVAFSPDGKALASADVQACVRVWDVGAAKETQQMDMKSGAERLALAFSPDGKTLACAGAWNDSSFLPKGGVSIQGVEMTPKEGYAVLLWEASTGKEVRRFTGPKDNIETVAFSPDGKTVAAGSRDGRVVLWDADGGKELLYILAHPGPAAAETGAAPGVGFSPDGKTLATAGADGALRLWDAATARELGRLEAADGRFSCLAVSTDGKVLVTGGADTTATVWDWAAVGKAPRNGKRPVIYIK